MAQMPAQKNYFRDRTVLVLLTVNIFLTLLASVWVLLRLSAGHGSSYIVQFRPSLGINAYTPGSLVDLLSFIVFAFLIFVFQFLLSMHSYRIHRQLSIAILSLGVLLLILTIIVSNALLVLH
jgi:hypothetical protein